MKTAHTAATLLGLVLLFAMHGAEGQSDGMTEARRQKVVDEHNRLRRTVSAVAMLKMEYDMKLECAARKFAEASGTWKGHNNNRVADYAACGGSGYVGENWFSAGPEDAAYYWVDFEWAYPGFNGCSERQNYVAETGDSNANAKPPNGATSLSKCTGGMTGHYTQVMWADSQRVGCWYTQAFGTVCNYAPGGNYMGEAYAVYGTKCSKCPSGFTVCDNGLCARTGTTPGSTTTTTAAPTTRPTTTKTTTTPPPPPTTTTTRPSTTGPQTITVTSLITIVQKSTVTVTPPTVTALVTITKPGPTTTVSVTKTATTCPQPTMGTWTVVTTKTLVATAKQVCPTKTLTRTATVAATAKAATTCPPKDENRMDPFVYPMVDPNPPMVLGGRPAGKTAAAS